MKTETEGYHFLKLLNELHNTSRIYEIRRLLVHNTSYTSQMHWQCYKDKKTLIRYLLCYYLAVPFTTITFSFALIILILGLRYIFRPTNYAIYTIFHFFAYLHSFYIHHRKKLLSIWWYLTVYCCSKNSVIIFGFVVFFFRFYEIQV